MKTFWLSQIPLWGVFFVTAVIVLLSVWLGTFLGQRRRLKPDHEAETSLGTINAAMLGLLAFLLAFTFGFSAQIFQNRRQLLLDEVNAIGTVYLRAGLLTEPYQSQIRKLLREYIDVRVNIFKQKMGKYSEEFKNAISHSENLQDQIWSSVTKLTQAGHDTPITAVFIQSLNEMIDLQTSRLTVLKYQIPHVVWYSLYFITILSMIAVGYQVGLTGKSVIKISIILALTFAAVILLITDLDRTSEGYLQVSQQPMFELQQKLQTSAQEAKQK